MLAYVSPLRWGILSTGRIAGVFAKGVGESRHGRLVAVGSRSAPSAARFAAEHGVAPPHAHASYEALLADPEVEAVYIATPHPEHVEWAVKAAEAGKHILCEKPAGLNHAEAMVMIEAAHRAGVLFMEAFMYRCHPQTAKIVELIREGAIGRVGLIQAGFGFRSDFKAESRLWNNALGGGGILDLGGYPMSFARLVAGAVAGEAAIFADPISVRGAGRLHPLTGVDSMATASLRFADGTLALVSCALDTEIDNTARIFGEKGRLEIPHPWIVTKGGGEQIIRLYRHGAAEPELITITAGNLYGIEADAFALALRSGEAAVSAMSPQDTLGNLAALDRWRAAIGLVYESERSSAATPLTLARRPLARRSSAAALPFSRISGLAKPIARLVLSCDHPRTFPHAAAMFDDYFERGGNAFDTAVNFGRGQPEAFLGDWLRGRRIRERAVVIVRGGQTPVFSAAHLVHQLHESLNRLGLEYCDVFSLGGGSLTIPIDELVEKLAGEARAGRIRGAYSAPDWTPARLAEARAYAHLRQIAAPELMSIELADTATHRWLSTQASGNGEIGAPHDLGRGDHLARRNRLLALAREKAVAPLALAAAYVLAQPLHSFARIDPRTLAETESVFGCLHIPLTLAECAWLNLEGDSR